MHCYDDGSVLHYNYYRTYDPSTGRYLDSDPIGLVAGPNTYVYVENMPTMYVDPLGLDKAENQRRANAMRGRHARNRGPLNLNGSVGAGDAVQYGPGGIALESGIAVGPDGGVCLYSRRCVSFGMGAFASLGGSVGGATGRLCSGSYKTFGFAGAGGAAGTGGTSIEFKHGGDRIGGLGGNRGYGGIGVGGFGGLIECS